MNLESRRYLFRGWSKSKNKMFENITRTSQLMWDKYEKHTLMLLM